MSEPAVRVGLVGAGPWAQLFTAPLVAASPELVLTGVWARRPDAAAQLAARHGVGSCDTLDELFGGCDAVAFAVPPAVQAELGSRAAAAGKALLLDKPIGRTVDEAQRLADAVAEAGVVSQVILTNRYLPMMRAFLADLAGFEAHGGRASFLGTGSVPGDYFATPWRLQDGGMLDLAPHVYDSLDCSLGPIVEVLSAHGDTLGTSVVAFAHQSGAVSSAAFSCVTPTRKSGLVVEVFGRDGHHVLDTSRLGDEERAEQWGAAAVTIAAEFAAAVRSGVDHPLNAAHGLHLQRLINRAFDLQRDS